MCECTPGFGGPNCSLIGRCHFWNATRAAWQSDGLQTELPAAGDGDFVTCVSVSPSGLNASSFAVLLVEAVAELPSLSFEEPHYAAKPSPVPWSPDPIALLVALLTVLDLLFLVLSYLRSIETPKRRKISFLGRRKNASQPADRDVYAGSVGPAPATPVTAAAEEYWSYWPTVMAALPARDPTNAQERGCAMGLQEGKRNQIQSFRDKILSFQLPDFLGGALRRGGKGAPSLQDQLQPWDLFATLRAPGTKMAPARRRNPGGKY